MNAEAQDNSRSIGLIERVYRVIASSLWVFWLGGLTFYIAIVVPVGGDVLGADIQGKVTERVTSYINITSVMVAVLLLSEARRRRSVGLLASTIIHALTLAVLFALHIDLAAMMQGKESSIWPKWTFYSVHRIYLWTSTAQWLNALIVHFFFFAIAWQRTEGSTTQVTSNV